MSDENVRIIRGWMEAWNEGDLEATLGYMDPEIEVEIAMDAPMDGRYQGHAGLVKAMTEFWGEFDSIESEITECIPTGDDIVMAVTHRATGASSGARVEISHWQIATMRAGKMVRWRNFLTREQALEAAGLSE